MNVKPWTLTFSLDCFYRHRHRFAAAKTQRGDAALQTALLEGVDQRYENPGATRANRVTERDAAAIHVHARKIKP